MNDQLSHTEALDVRSYLRPIRRRKWIILLITIVAAGATYAISSHEQKTYTSSTRLYVQDPTPAQDLLLNPGSSGPPSPTQLANSAQLMTARSITSAVTRALGPSAASAGSVTATPSTDSSF